MPDGSDQNTVELIKTNGVLTKAKAAPFIPGHDSNVIERYEDAVAPAETPRSFRSQSLPQKVIPVGAPKVPQVTKEGAAMAAD